MEAYLLDWISLLLRWTHVVVAMAWIGASFYFIWLDNSLQPAVRAEDAARGVSGELWAIHGGGIYHAQKYRLAPEVMPATLHWFKWEAYWTWMSGFSIPARSISAPARSSSDARIWRLAWREG